MITLWKYIPSQKQGDSQLIQLENQAERLDELVNWLPAGVYTTFRTYHKEFVLNLSAHIQRLEHSATLKSCPMVINEGELRQHLRLALRNHPAQENRVRIIATLDKYQINHVIYIAVEDLSTPSQALYTSGVRAKTVKLFRQNPGAKATDFIYQTRQLRGQITDGLNELLMIDEKGDILEGLSSNFFAVRDQKIYTRAEGVLPGITRDLVIQIIDSLQVELFYTAIKMADLSGLDEAFITSTSRGVLPVVMIDDVRIGSGSPGKITQHLHAQYEREVERAIQLI